MEINKQMETKIENRGRRRRGSGVRRRRRRTGDVVVGVFVDGSAKGHAALFFVVSFSHQSAPRRLFPGSWRIQMCTDVGAALRPRRPGRVINSYRQPGRAGAAPPSRGGKQDAVGGNRTPWAPASAESAGTHHGRGGNKGGPATERGNAAKSGQMFHSEHSGMPLNVSEERGEQESPGLLFSNTSDLSWRGAISEPDYSNQRRSR